jgi:DNA repair exonuclease SbcCD ATPase subunit
MDHIKLTDELRNQLLESAAWGKVGITPVERVDEATSEVVEKEEEAPAVEAEEDTIEEAHVCPLCTSELSEAIEEDRILEHLEVVVGLVDRLSQLDESEEDVDAVIDATIKEILLQDVTEEE